MGLSITIIEIPHWPKMLKFSDLQFYANAVCVGITSFFNSAEIDVLL